MSLYTKPPLSLEDQVAMLLRRGMQGDPERMKRKLAVVNYYRLSGYWFPFKSGQGEAFVPDTSFDVVWNRYCFDRKLRLHVLDAIERIEVAIRSRLAYFHAHQHGTFAYLDDPTSLPDFRDARDRERFTNAVRDESWRSKERFIRHYNNKYTGQNGKLPVWMLAEVISFGTLCRFYQASKPSLRKEVAKVFGIDKRLLKSWMVSLNSTRNICAHHGRLWNRVLPVKPLMPNNPRRHPDWKAPIEIKNTKVFGTLTILGYMLKWIAPHSLWKNRTVDLLQENPDVPVRDMGFPDGWEASPLWKLVRV